jgi:EAL domain-containing protein (putative c-di-GMP-specific phosphodiesterase class I)
MIAEQDFILQIRRLNRLNAPRTVVNVIRQIADYSNTSQVPDRSETELMKIAEKMMGAAHIMSNGDVFLIVPTFENAQLKLLRENIGAVLNIADHIEPEKYFFSYQLPKDYTTLRERANVYVELARATEVIGPVRQAENALQAEEVRGPLTAYSLAQVEKLLDNIDIKRYVRTQPIYMQGEDGEWEKQSIDFYISIQELKRERFPRLNLATPERLFLELCCTLDRKLLTELTNQLDNWKHKKISLNLSAETVLSHAFAQFCHVLPKGQRHNVSFEIHRSDLFLNFTATRNAIEVLRAEGFVAGIDGITPSTLPYINFSLFNADFYKINVTRDKWPELKEPQALQALQALPREKVIFSQCDHDESLREGQKLGIRYFQGWLIDDAANSLAS